MERLIQSARRYHMEPALITQPALYGDVIDPTTGVNLATVPFREGNGATEWATLELYNEVTRQVARDQNVLLIDLAHEMPKDSQYFRDMIHYTNSGSKIVANILYPPLCLFLADRFPEYVELSCRPQ